MDEDFLKAQIDAFHKYGFEVWMDDFGSGYSSLNMLQKFDFDTIKFDMRFMREFSESHKSHIILKELVQMAVKLNINTVVEGVETLEQVKFLREIGVNKMQGYYWDKPHSIEDKHTIYITNMGSRPEDLVESDYYNAISRANLTEPIITGDVQIDKDEYFGPIPMGVIEFKKDSIHILRYNKTYALFLLKTGFVNQEDLGTGDLLVKRIPEPNFIQTVSLYLR